MKTKLRTLIAENLVLRTLVEEIALDRACQEIPLLPPQRDRRGTRIPVYIPKGFVGGDGSEKQEATDV